jgi:hypothetical protein
LSDNRHTAAADGKTKERVLVVFQSATLSPPPADNELATGVERGEKCAIEIEKNSAQESVARLIALSEK